MAVLSPLLLAACLATALAVSVTINNTLPRLDSTGAILDGHDGRITKFGGKYWLHTLSYGMCHEPEGQGCNQPAPKPKEGYCGFRLDHNISIWTSPDLSSGSWEFVGLALNWTDRPPGTVFRPDVVFNPNTGKWVLWWNQVAPNGTYLGFISGVSDSPAGPFINLTTVTGLTASNATMHAGDFHIFVDDDGAGYVLYSSEHWMYLDKLSPDFLSGSGEAGVQHLGGIYFVEAPQLIKRQGQYLALFDHCCCFCYQGSGIRVYTATSPLGPYTPQGAGADLACVPPSPSSPPSSTTPGYALGLGLLSPITPEPTPGQGCLYNGSTTVSTTRSQQSSIAVVDTPTGPLYLWTGDRWQQAPDGVKGHEPQFWTPLQFDADGHVLPVAWVDAFTMDVV